VLNVKSDEELYHRLGYIHREIASAREQITALSDTDHSLYLPHFSKLEATIHPEKLGRSWKDTRGALTGEVMQALAFAADSLSRSSSEKEIQRTEILGLRKGTEDLWKQVSETEVSDPLKKFILRQLSVVLNALMEYEIRGPDAFEDAIGRIVALRLTDPPMRDRLQKSRWRQKAWSVFAKIAQFARFSRDMKELAPAGLEEVLKELADK
jgi:hypothetical protein